MFALFDLFDIFRPFRSGGEVSISGIASALSDESDLLHLWGFQHQIGVMATQTVASQLEDSGDLLHYWSARSE